MKYILNDGKIYDIDPSKGLPLEVFLELSSLMPIANVDLLVINAKGEVLLTWRDDPYYGKGWHLPGGCMRFRETMAERLHKTAIAELGCDVIADEEPLAVRDVIVDRARPLLENNDVRAHNLAVLFKCRLLSENRLEIMTGNDEKTIDDLKSGDAKWFKKIPKDILFVHSVYNDVFKKFGLMEDE